MTSSTTVQQAFCVLLTAQGELIYGTQSLLEKWNPKTNEVVTQNTQGSTNNVLIDSKNNLISCTSGIVSIWNIQDLTLKSVLADWHNCIGLLPSGVVVCGNSSGEIQLWDLPSKSRIGLYSVHSRSIDYDSIRSIVTTEDGYIISCGADCRVCITDPREAPGYATKLLYKTDIQITTLCFMPASDVLVCGDEAGGIHLLKLNFKAIDGFKKNGHNDIFQTYLRSHLRRNNQGKYDSLKLLTNISSVEWIQNRIEASGLKQCLTDIEMYKNDCGVDLVKRALTQSAHIANDELAFQILLRLQPNLKSQLITRLRASSLAYLQSSEKPYPVLPSLTSSCAHCCRGRLITGVESTIISCMSFDDGSRTAYLGYTDGHVVLLDLFTMESDRLLGVGYQYEVPIIALSSPSPGLVVCSYVNNTLVIWEKRSSPIGSLYERIDVDYRYGAILKLISNGPNDILIVTRTRILCLDIVTRRIAIIVDQLQAPIVDLCVSTGAYMVTIAANGSIFMYDLTEGRLLQIWRLPETASNLGLCKRIVMVSASSVAVVDGSPCIYILDLSQGRTLAKIHLPSQFTPASIFSLPKFGSLAIVDSCGTLIHVDLSTNQCSFHLRIHTSPIILAYEFPDTLFTLSIDGSQVIKPKSESNETSKNYPITLHHTGQVNCLLNVAQDKLLSVDSDCIIAWDLRSHQNPNVFCCLKNNIYSPIVINKKIFCLSSSMLQQVDPETLAVVPSNVDLVADYICPCPSGLLLGFSVNSKEVSCLNIRTGLVSKKLLDSEFPEIHFIIPLSSGMLLAFTQQATVIIDTHSLRLRTQHHPYTHTVAACVDSTGVACGIYNFSEIAVLDISRDGLGPRFTLDGHEGAVTALYALSDGRLISGSVDCTVRIWDLNDPEPHMPLLVFVGDYEICSLHCLEDHRLVVIGDAGGRVHFIKLPEYSRALINQHNAVEIQREGAALERDSQGWRVVGGGGMFSPIFNYDAFWSWADKPHRDQKDDAGNRNQTVAS